MSITISATSLAIMGAVAALRGIAGVAQDVIFENFENSIENSIESAITKNDTKEILKEYQTPFVDCEILEKTLIEHGCENFSKNGEYGFSCEIENFTFIFSRDNIENPFKMEIKCNEGANCDMEIDDLSEEYKMNVQEETYVKLTQRLKNNNMTVESEQILEDDTIMLTVNVE